MSDNPIIAASKAVESLLEMIGLVVLKAERQLGGTGRIAARGFQEVVGILDAHRGVFTEFRDEFTKASKGMITAGDETFPSAHIAAFELSELFVKSVQDGVFYARVAREPDKMVAFTATAKRLMSEDREPPEVLFSDENREDAMKAAVWFWEKYCSGVSPKRISVLIELERSTLIERSQVNSGNPTAKDSDELPRASADYRSVFWYGESYQFTATQAACVRVLWEAWRNGTPEVGDATILELADSSTDRVPLVFRGNPAYRAMIQPGSTKGTHRLAIPEKK